MPRKRGPVDPSNGEVHGRRVLAKFNSSIIRCSVHDVHFCVRFFCRLGSVGETRQRKEKVARTAPRNIHWVGVGVGVGVGWSGGGGVCGEEEVCVEEEFV